ncbi:MAG: hypothetical protein ACTSQY_05640 [Candidatus Odinarchaeia archaeon]
MFIEEVVKIIKENISPENRKFVEPPEDADFFENMIYKGELTSSHKVGVKELPLDAITKVEKEFGGHITTNLKLKYTTVADSLDETVNIRAVLGNLCFMSPLEIYSRQEDINGVKNVKADWLIGVFKQTNEIIFFYLNFLSPSIKAMFRAGLQLDFDFASIENIRVKTFLDNFNGFLTSLRELISESGLDWAKLTEINMHQRIIIKSKGGKILKEVLKKGVFAS